MHSCQRDILSYHTVVLFVIPAKTALSCQRNYLCWTTSWCCWQYKLCML